MTRRTPEQLAELLTAWARHHDLHVRAAVERLIAQDTFLRRPAFVDAAVHVTADGAYVSFRDARKAFDAGDFDVASSTELAILDLIIAVGEDRYRFSRMGPQTSQFVLDLMHTALDYQATR